MRDSSRLLGFAVAVIALGLVAAVLGPRLLGLASGPEVELISQLKKAERGAEFRVDGNLLVGTALQYQRLSVMMDASGESALVTGTLDFTGVFAHDTQVSSLGLERIPFVLRGGDWVAPDGYAPRLCAIVRSLEVRRKALEAADPVPLPDGGVDPQLAWLRSLRHRSYQSNAWFIRSERERVEVAEDYRLQGDAPERPVDDKATKRLVLEPDGHGGFSYPDGVM